MVFSVNKCFPLLKLVQRSLTNSVSYEMVKLRYIVIKQLSSFKILKCPTVVIEVYKNGCEIVNSLVFTAQIP